MRIAMVLLCALDSSSSLTDLAPAEDGSDLAPPGLPERSVAELTLLSLDWRVVRSGPCAEQEILGLTADPELRRSAVQCYRDDCYCRGGSWIAEKGVCSHLCTQVRCPDARPCRAQGSCDPRTGVCSEPELPDGTECTLGVGSSPGLRCVRGACVVPQQPCARAGEEDKEEEERCPEPAWPQCARAVCTIENATAAPSGPGHQKTSAPAPPVKVCSELPVPDGTPCSDNNPETGPDACIAGVCSGGARDLCTHVPAQVRGDCGTEVRPGPGPCYETLPQCNPETGYCLERPVADGTPCDDTSRSTSNDRCLRGACVGEAACGNGVRCTALQAQCQTSSCLSGSGGTQGLCSLADPPKPDGTPCSDGNPETHGERCMAGSCVGAERFYGCGNNRACYAPLLTCMARLFPSCARYYRAQCVAVAAHLQCDPDDINYYCVASAHRTSAGAATAAALALALLY